MLRWLTAGESHGPALVAVIEGLPAGVEVTSRDVAAALARRRLGFGRGARMAFEQDEVEFLGGLRHGLTLGSPVAIRIGNTEWPKWETVMSPDPVEDAELAAADDVNAEKELARNRPLTKPRPGHADLVGMQKYGFTDARPILERASARETAARVVAGCLAKALLAQCEIQVFSHVTRIGQAPAPEHPKPSPSDLEAIDESPVRCFDPEAAAAMVDEVKGAEKAGDSVGGVFEVLSYGLPSGLGSHVHWDRKIDGRLAQALMSIQAIKGVEVGEGFAAAADRGSDVHDEIGWLENVGYVRISNRSGGTEGGMTTGEVLSVRAAMKPLSTLNRPLRTIDMVTKESVMAFKERTDHCAVPAAGVVGEAMVALVVADELVRKTGGDSLEEVRQNLTTYRRMVRWS